MTVAALAAMILTLTACGNTTNRPNASRQPPFPSGADADNRVLLAGRRVYGTTCARCHGAAGRGGFGPPLVGIATKYPNLDDQVAVVANGRRAMPSFAGELTDEEIRSVVRYEREVL